MKRLQWCICLLGMLLVSQNARADYYDVWLPEGYLSGTLMSKRQLVGYNFAAATLNNALCCDIADGTSLYIWDYDSGAWMSSAYVSGYGWFPNYTLEPGTAFFIDNPGATGRWLRIYGDQMTSSTYSKQIQQGKSYFLASAYKLMISFQGVPWNIDLPLECMDDGPYIHFSINYPASVGDVVYQWDVDNQNYGLPLTRSVDQDGHKIWVNCGTDVSPNIVMYKPYIPGLGPEEEVYGGGFLLVPASSKTWTHIGPSGDHLCP